MVKKQGGKPRRPGARQVSFWSDGKEVRKIDRMVKRDGYSSRSKWLHDVVMRAAKAERAME